MHWEATKRIPGYLKSTRGCVLAFSGKLNNETFIVADWGNCCDSKISSDFVTIAALYWEPRKQNKEALRAEQYGVLMKAVKADKSLKGF